VVVEEGELVLTEVLVEAVVITTILEVLVIPHLFLRHKEITVDQTAAPVTEQVAVEAAQVLPAAVQEVLYNRLETVATELHLLFLVRP
jgi:hypothetical protein